MTHTARLFFALEISPALRKIIASTVQHLKEKNITQHIRWIAPENWHLTLCFLGTVSFEKIDIYLELVEKSLQTLRQFEFTLGRLCVFSDRHPRLLVVQIPLSQALAALQSAIQNALVAVGFEQEKRDFFPHITLGKFSTDFPVSLDETIIPTTQSQQVKEVVLFSSKTAPKGSIYTVVQRLAI